MTSVLHVIDQLNVGGAEVLTVNILNSLSKEADFKVNIAVTRKEGPLKEDISSKVNYYFLKKKKAFDFCFLINLYKLVKKQNVKIIHAHNTSYFSCVLISFFLAKKRKLIWHNHTGAYVNLSGIKLKILKFCSLYFDVIINVNAELNNWSMKKLKCKKNVVLNNFATFSNDNKNTLLEGIEGKRIVSLAGFRPVKNHEYLINGFEVFLKEYPDWTLHLVGKNYKDEYYNRILDIISNKKLERNIFLYGLRRDIKNILNQSTIGVLTSKKEGLPISVLEYGLANLPVIVTDTSNTADLIVKEGTVSSENHIYFSNKLKEVAENKKLRTKISDQLKLKVSNFFSEKYFIRELKNIYNNI